MEEHNPLSRLKKQADNAKYPDSLHNLSKQIEPRKVLPDGNPLTNLHGMVKKHYRVDGKEWC